MNTGLLRFTNSEIDNGIKIGGKDVETDTIVGGISLSKYLQSYDKNEIFTPKKNTEQYKRFSNYIIPAGLSINKKDSENTIPHDDTEQYNTINNARFDALLFSVGKDLGISRRLRPISSNKEDKHLLLEKEKNKTKKLFLF